ncbi:MAG: enoyl-CoA hydratase-related protein [Actinomycetota bacterium]|nr:enoyl-CoA hydratase-related protein [Actinomycetota bacterium]
MALVEVATEGDVATLTLNRPDARNALSVELCEAIILGLGDVDRSHARSLIVRGAGSVFCSGADVNAVSGTDGLDFLPTFEKMLETLARFRIPTVAAIQGAALGGGFQLACCCDFRIASADAKLGIPAARLGILVNFENIERLVLLAGIARTKEVLMTARSYSGAEAEATGLVTMHVEADALDDAVLRFATELAARSPLSVQGTKRAIETVSDQLSGVRATKPGSADAIDELVAQAYRSRDLQEGLKALSEKREPDFTGM